MFTADLSLNAPICMGEFMVNSFKSNGISDSNQLDQSISVLRGDGILYFIQIFIHVVHSVNKQWRP